MSPLERYEHLTPANKETFGRMVIALAMQGEQMRKAVPMLQLPNLPTMECVERFIGALENERLYHCCAGSAISAGVKTPCGAVVANNEKEP